MQKAKFKSCQSVLKLCYLGDSVKTTDEVISVWQRLATPLQRGFLHVSFETWRTLRDTQISNLAFLPRLGQIVAVNC
jgi:hypothetical protein